MEPNSGPDAAAAPTAPAIGMVVVRPALFRQLDRARRITEVSAPAGSGKTFLLRSWISQRGMAGDVAWVSVRPGLDPQQFWIAVADALRGTAGAAALVRPLTPAPDLDGWTVMERLLKDLAQLTDRVWLVIDDAHELNSAEALRQLELLALRAPEQLRFVLATRHDLLLPLHRLRLEGELTEIRAANLRLTIAEAQALFDGAGVALSHTALTLLYARTEGWAAGLRLAALSLSGHPDPERFAAEFSGSERTVASYLLAEVLDRQSEQVRRLLLRTSLLDRVSGELADLLTGGSGSERMLQDLEQAGAFVVSLDAQRRWFRYHQMFADLLRLELRRTAPDEISRLHLAAAGWLSGHQFPVEAVRHAQAARDWALAARLLSDHWITLYLDGQAVTTQRLLGAFPAEVVAADAELTTLAALGELNRGSLAAAERHWARAARGLRDSDGPTPDRRERLRVFLSIVRLRIAAERVDPRTVAAEAARLLSPSVSAASGSAGSAGIDADLRALVLVNLGIAETWAAQLDDADRHLEQGLSIARRARRPYIEFAGLAYGARVVMFRSLKEAELRGRHAIEFAERNGWGDDQVAAFAYTMLGAALTGQGRLAEAELWLERAGHTVEAEAHPPTKLNLSYARGLLEVARGRHRKGLSELLAGARLADGLITPGTLARPIQALMLLAQAHLGEIDRAEAVLTGLSEDERHSVELRVAQAALLLARHKPQVATAILAPVLDGSVTGSEVQQTWVVEAFLLESIARDASDDPDVAWQALERALEIAGSDRVLVPFLLHPEPRLLREHARRATAHAALITDILKLLPEAARSSPAAEPHPETRLLEPLSQAEIRVLRYLPTRLSVSEIADQLYLSVNTVGTHMRHLYAKLGVHRRHEAVEQARVLGLLAPAARQP